MTIVIAKIDDLISDGNYRWKPPGCKPPLLRSGQRVYRLYAAVARHIRLISVFSSAKIDYPISHGRRNAIFSITLSTIYFPFRLPIMTIESMEGSIARPHEKQIACDNWRV